MTYFRVKRQRLGAAYERFLAGHLDPGGTVLLVDCTLSWPTTRVGERHVFQQGALGGATVAEGLQGGERVADYLRRYGSHRRRWAPPPPDGDRPEADPSDELHMGLFSHGVDSVGLATVDRWRSVLGRAGKIGTFLGVDEQAFPRDFTTLARYHQARARVRKRSPIPAPLSLADLDAFLDGRAGGTPSTGGRGAPPGQGRVAA